MAREDGGPLACVMTPRWRVLVSVASLLLAACDGGSSFRSDWISAPDRRWVGADYWANRLQDWRVADGRLESLAALPMRTVHLLTRRLGDDGDLELSVRLGVRGSTPNDSGLSTAGFLIGAGAELDYRAASLIHHSHGVGAGLYGGIDSQGRIFLRDMELEDMVLARTNRPVGLSDSTVLRLRARRRGDTYEVEITTPVPDDPQSQVGIRTGGIPASRLRGNIALVSDTRPGGTNTFWFSDWSATGSKLERHEGRALGPVIGMQHTLSRRTLKLTAQFMPLGPSDIRTAELQKRVGRSWQTVASAEIVEPGYTATFTVTEWNDTTDAPIRVVYDQIDANGSTRRYTDGTIRKDPIDEEELVVAAFTGNHNVQRGVERPDFPWTEGVWFPHADIVRNVRAHDPDLLFFSGDQIYEGASPTRADFNQPYEDYLYKWYIWFWAFGELTAELPAVTIPDDHDVFHGNVWGASGKATPPGLTGAPAQDAGGYKLPAAWVNMVQRTQTSHLPDPYDPTPVFQNIGVYYTDVLYGGVSFAVLEDRKFKSAPAALLPDGDVWNGWPRNPRFDPKASADAPGATLLGERQLRFLDQWSSDWRDGTWMKVVLSQTLFANVATLPAGELTGAIIPSLEILSPDAYAEGDYVVSDMDSNGWPQTGRNRALRAMRKGFALHLAGDQHLGSTIRYGVDDWGDAGYALCVPSIANFWPRRWYPPDPGGGRAPDAPRYTGNYVDGFGNKMTVLAVSNPARWGKEPEALHDRAPGYGIAKLNRTTRQVSLAAWPRWADPAHGGSPYPGWPVVIDQVDNYGREPAAFLPHLEITGMDNPVVQVVSETTGGVVYTLRIRGRSLTPWVFSSGRYTVFVGEPATTRWRQLTGLETSPVVNDTIRVAIE